MKKYIISGIVAIAIIGTGITVHYEMNKPDSSIKVSDNSIVKSVVKSTKVSVNQNNKTDDNHTKEDTNIDKCSSTDTKINSNKNITTTSNNNNSSGNTNKIITSNNNGDNTDKTITTNNNNNKTAKSVAVADSSKHSHTIIGVSTRSSNDNKQNNTPNSSNNGVTSVSDNSTPSYADANLYNSNTKYKKAVNDMYSYMKTVNLENNEYLLGLLKNPEDNKYIQTEGLMGQIQLRVTKNPTILNNLANDYGWIQASVGGM